MIKSQLKFYCWHDLLYRPMNYRSPRFVWMRMCAKAPTFPTYDSARQSSLDKWKKASSPSRRRGGREVRVQSHLPALLLFITIAGYIPGRIWREVISGYNRFFQPRCFSNDRWLVPARIWRELQLLPGGCIWPFHCQPECWGDGVIPLNPCFGGFWKFQ